jgi:hypothetical protein
MRKLSLYFTCFFALVLIGCGETSGNPTAQIATLIAEPADVAPGGSAIITATVIKTAGKEAEATVTAPGLDENVTFKLLTANGGQLSTRTQKADSKGEAKTVYTAGNNYNYDVIQVTLDNGMSASIMIQKKGTLIGARIFSLLPASTNVKKGQTTVITATVTNGDGTRPVMAEAVTFATATNESGGCFISATQTCVTSVTVNSDADGKAVAVYKAGGNSSTIDVYDSIWAFLSNGSSRVIVITRSASTILGYSLTVTPVPATLASKAGLSVVTANVKNNNVAVSGITVTFRVVSGTIGGTVSPGTAITDGSGNAVTIYEGATGARTGDTDAVQAGITVDGVTYNAATVITAP